MPDPDLEIRGRGDRSSRPLDREEGSRSPKKIFSALRVSVWSKNNGWLGAPRASPLDPPLNKTQGWTMHPLSSS